MLLKPLDELIVDRKGFEAKSLFVDIEYGFRVTMIHSC